MVSLWTHLVRREAGIFLRCHRGVLLLSKEEIELHVTGDTHSDVVLFNESCMEADCFADLLLHQVIPIASYLKVVPYVGVD